MAKTHSKKKLTPFIPWVTLCLIGLYLVFFFWEQRAMNVGLFGYLIQDYSFNWAQFVADPIASLPRLLSHTLIHADITHLGSNCLFLLVFGPAIEKRLGPLVFVSGYFIWGALAALTQGAFSPFSGGLIGASGAISGTAGAFFVLYPLKTPPDLLVFWLGSWLRRIPAFFWIGLWFLDQIRQGFLSLLPAAYLDQISLIGYWAHIGGFTAGALTLFPFIFRRKSSR